MIDITAPIRLRDSKRPVYHTGFFSRDIGIIWIGDQDRWGLHGARYHLTGLPYDRTPWGAIENYDPLAELQQGWEEVVNPAEARKRREEIAAVEDNEIFGLF